MDNKLIEDKMVTDENRKLLLRAKRKEGLTRYFEEKKRLSFVCADKPKVSILLVLWNQAELTLACLEALQTQADGTWEILIIDNASTDKTRDLLDTIDGARIVYNEENIGFLKAVNLGALQANGEYLLLLNNDAVPHEGSISQAVRTIESSQDVGAVGGRVILPNGLLQEAGSIVWRDGTCLGYARNCAPEDNSVMFMRDVDYCSGVFLLTKTQLFRDMGGFDLRYVPAYYEESDYCIRLWKSGFRVVYDPFVVLDHYEFGSSSTSDDAMRLMKINQLKFLEAHQEYLADHYVADEKNVLAARMRNHYKSKVLVIDDRVPMGKLGAGYPRANSILNALVQSQCFVTFYPLQHITDEWKEVYDNIPPTIEVMLNCGIDNLESFLEERKDYYDAIVISRPINMKPVKDIYNRRPELFEYAKIIYDAEALWAAREILQSEIQGQSLQEHEKTVMINEEVALASFSNTVLTVTHSEAQYFINAGYDDVHVLGHTLEARITPNEFDDRKNILFVGTMAESGTPNVDSVEWFVENVLPLINQGVSEQVKVYLIGKTGASELEKLASEQVMVLGIVDDLTEWYNTCRIFIAPTRFAAGIPHKVHEASSFGLPTVVTPVLAQQLNWQHENEILIGKTAKDYAEQCVRLYTDKALWINIRENAVNRIVQEHSNDQFRRELANVLNRN